MKLIQYLQCKFIYRPSRSRLISVKNTDFDPKLSRDIQMHTEDNLQLNGWHLRSEHADREESSWSDSHPTRPRVVLFLAGNSSNRQRRITQFKIFLELGLDVVCFDYRGYGDNPGRPREEDIARDAHAAWEYVTKNLNYKPEEVLICGQSLGGAVAVRLASELNQQEVSPCGLILCATFTSLKEAAQSIYPRLPLHKFLVESYSSIDRIRQVTCPLIFFHGTQDEIVPMKLGEKLYKAAERFSEKGVPKRFVELPEANHNNFAVVEREIYQRGLRHFIYNLVPPPDSATMLIMNEA
ncbi:Alpha/beta hydrolase family protein [Polystyrenella longa]|uniref:Alpha/beta hydrolase family protein n=1 Tax=Polystyrenella longa TaxID=2528007 RepID=A0A518CP52_9PLAN|nr:alpha/beta hydrolase [Polystyrenella longa]QDU81002.1 Alpha/beta hydrolase family protein [Polystyrenella longa]